MRDGSAPVIRGAAALVIRGAAALVLGHSRHWGCLVGQSNPPFMSGVPELLVLRVLSRGEMYGYELVKTIRIVTNDAISLGEGVVYPALYGLEHRGALKARRKTVNGRSRVYYTITAQGLSRLEQLTDEWQRITGGIHTALEEPGRA
jgi:PadR family transcriptional regulator PadR